MKRWRNLLKQQELRERTYIDDSPRTKEKKMANQKGGQVRLIIAALKIRQWGSMHSGIQPAKVWINDVEKSQWHKGD